MFKYLLSEEHYCSLNHVPQISIRMIIDKSILQLQSIFSGSLSSVTNLHRWNLVPAAAAAHPSRIWFATAAHRRFSSPLPLSPTAVTYYQLLLLSRCSPAAIWLLLWAAAGNCGFCRVIWRGKWCNIICASYDCILTKLLMLDQLRKVSHNNN